LNISINTGNKNESNEKDLYEIFKFLRAIIWIRPVLIFSDPNYAFTENHSNALYILDKYKEINKHYALSHWPLYLIRPDGYIAFRSREINFSPLKKFCEKLCHI
jgi:hypothetical protein